MSPLKGARTLVGGLAKNAKVALYLGTPETVSGCQPQLNEINV